MTQVSAQFDHAAICNWWGHSGTGVYWSIADDAIVFVRIGVISSDMQLAFHGNMTEAPCRKVQDTQLSEAHTHTSEPRVNGVDQS